MSHYKPYPAYKDSGVEWLGMVPEHWRKFKVGRNAPFSIGWTPSTSDSSNFSDDVPWVNISDLGPEVISATSKGISNKALIDKGATILPVGTLLFSFKLTVGSISFLGVPAVTNEAIAAFPPVVGVDAKFFYYAAPEFVPKYGRENIYGSLLLNQELIQGASTFFPPFEEQRAIAAHLDRETARIDALVTKKTRFIELLREKRQALITHAVTKGLDPKVKMKDSGVEWLGEVPEHWEVSRLKFVATVQTGVAKGKDTAGEKTVEVPYLRVANVQDGYLDLTDVATIEIVESDLPRYLLQRGDVLMNEGGDFDKLGRGHVWSGEIDPCIHQNHVFAVRSHAVSPAWLNTFTSSAAAQFYFMGRSKQSTNLASISSSNLMELPIPLPPQEEQASILASLSSSLLRVDAVIRKSERSIELLKERRSALITAAVTGQIDLREAA